MSLFDTTLELAEQSLERRLASPSTLYDSGGTIDSHTFEGQEISRDELRDVKQMREKGGIVTQLVHAKATMQFGTGVEWHVDDDDLDQENDQGQNLVEWLEDEFNDIDTLVLD